MKKIIVFVVFVFAVASLTSCRSKKSSCTKVNTQEILQNTPQDVDVACIENE